MKHFGIIGKPLVQSFSANYFNQKFRAEHIDAEYSLYPLANIEAFTALIADARKRFADDGGLFAGMNVTIPYKTAIIPYLTTLDETAATIGAVNVIQFMPDGRTCGYNTDAPGFIDAIRPHLKKTDRHALILGTGGAAKACRYGLNKLGISTIMASRTPQEGQVSYDHLRLGDYQVIVNCTPLGMFPETAFCPPIPYEQLTAEQFLFDCIYNPEETLFLRHGREKGCRTQNGIEMLLGQARAAERIWSGVEIKGKKNKE